MTESRLGKTWTRSARCLISVLTRSVGLLDQIFFQCSAGKAAKAVRSALTAVVSPAWAWLMTSAPPLRVLG